MNIDPYENMVVFDVGRADPFVTSVPTRADDGIQRAWLSLPADHRAAASTVRRIYSEWQPSASDAAFIERTFPQADVTYSFARPGPDGWDAAFAAARQTIAQAAHERETERVTQNMEHVARTGEPLPILWSRTSPKIRMLEILPHAEVIPGRLYVTVATVAPTPHGTVGLNHLTTAALGGRRFEEVLAEASGSLVRGLRGNGHADRDQPAKGQLLVLERDGPFASSAVALSDFHQQMVGALGDTGLLVGLPDPDTVLVTRMDSGWVDDVRRPCSIRPVPRESSCRACSPWSRRVCGWWPNGPGEAEYAPGSRHVVMVSVVHAPTWMRSPGLRRTGWFGVNWSVLSLR